MGNHKEHSLRSLESHETMARESASLARQIMAQQLNFPSSGWVRTKACEQEEIDKVALNFLDDARRVKIGASPRYVLYVYGRKRGTIPISTLHILHLSQGFRGKRV